MYNTTIKSFALLITTIFFISCNSQSQKSKPGVLEGNVFISDYFGINLQVNTPWHILNKKQLLKLMTDRIEIQYENAGKNISASKGIEILLSLTIDTIENMPHVLISSLDMTMFPQIKNEKDYLDDYFKQVNKMYEGYDLQITSSELEKEKIGNKTFSTILITIKSENFLAFQKRYSIKVNNSLLNIMANYNSDIYLKECQKLLNRIKWE